MMLRYCRFGVGRGGSRGRHVGRVVVECSYSVWDSVLFYIRLRILYKLR
jgi:hypothetical protein